MQKEFPAVDQIVFLMFIKLCQGLDNLKTGASLHSYILSPVSILAVLLDTGLPPVSSSVETHQYVSRNILLCAYLRFHSSRLLNGKLMYCFFISKFVTLFELLSSQGFDAELGT